MSQLTPDQLDELVKLALALEIDHPPFQMEPEGDLTRLAETTTPFSGDRSSTLATILLAADGSIVLLYVFRDPDTSEIDRIALHVRGKATASGIAIEEHFVLTPQAGSWSLACDTRLESSTIVTQTPPADGLEEQFGVGDADSAARLLKLLTGAQNKSLSDLV